jgi:hypothetical protein
VILADKGLTGAPAAAIAASRDTAMSPAVLKVKGLFDQLDTITKQGASNEEKGALVAKIRGELSVHESVENELFFPAVRETPDAIQALGDLNPGNTGYDKEVGELVRMIGKAMAECPSLSYVAVALCIAARLVGPIECVNATANNFVFLQI